MQYTLLTEILMTNSRHRTIYCCHQTLWAILRKTSTHSVAVMSRQHYAKWKTDMTMPNQWSCGDFHFHVKRWQCITEYIKAGIPATLALRQFLIFCAPLLLKHSEAPTLNKVQYLADKYVSKAPGFIKSWPRRWNFNFASTIQLPRTCEAVEGACLHLSHPGLPTSPSLNIHSL
jgi:hypothetical protein